MFMTAFNYIVNDENYFITLANYKAIQMCQVFFWSGSVTRFAFISSLLWTFACIVQFCIRTKTVYNTTHTVHISFASAWWYVNTLQKGADCPINVLNPVRHHNYYLTVVVFSFIPVFIFNISNVLYNEYDSNRLAVRNKLCYLKRTIVFVE